ncbi:MAG: hypothetical protein WA446_18355 [Steroidobacteraceae bacterium]
MKLLTLFERRALLVYSRCVLCARLGYRFGGVYRSVMLGTAFVILSVVVLLGSVLAHLHSQTGNRTEWHWPLATLHGLFAITGLGCLVLALVRSPRGLDQGNASFGIGAAALLALAALVGLTFLATQVLKGRHAGILIGIHATLAVSGFVVLAAYVFVG